MNPENAAIASGYSKSYARAKAYRIERSANVGMHAAFEQAGLTDKAIVAHGLSGLNAMKLQSCNIMVSHTSQDADSLVINKNSNDFVEIEDWNVRHKYYETILKLTDRIKLNPLIDQSQHKHYEVTYFNRNGQDTNSRVSGIDTPVADRSSGSI